MGNNYNKFNIMIMISQNNHFTSSIFYLKKRKPETHKHLFRSLVLVHTMVQMFFRHNVRRSTVKHFSVQFLDKHLASVSSTSPIGYRFVEGLPMVANQSILQPIFKIYLQWFPYLKKKKNNRHSITTVLVKNTFKIPSRGS